MREFVKSLKRLYDAGKINKDYVNELASKDKITEVEKVYILG